VDWRREGLRHYIEDHAGETVDIPGFKQMRISFVKVIHDAFCVSALTGFFMAKYSKIQVGKFKLVKGVIYGDNPHADRLMAVQ